jgi:hypothetical protein
MFVATVITSLLLAGLMAFAAIRKLSHQEHVVAAYTRVGVPADRLDYLAILLLAGAVGLLVGLFWAPIGVAATGATIAYFLLAIAAHLRHDDAVNVGTPVLMELIAVGALILRLATM